jgi:hypothetical protein
LVLPDGQYLSQLIQQCAATGLHRITSL